MRRSNKDSLAPGIVQAFDVRTGTPRWTFNPIPRPGEVGSETWEDDSWSYSGEANVWSLMSADEQLGLAYLPTGAPTNDMYGGHRLGDNLFGEQPGVPCAARPASASGTTRRSTTICGTTTTTSRRSSSTSP